MLTRLPEISPYSKHVREYFDGTRITWKRYERINILDHRKMLGKTQNVGKNTDALHLPDHSDLEQ